MNLTQIDVLLVGLAVLAGLGVIAAFRSGARSAYRVARQTQHVTRMGGNLVRALGTAAVIVGMRWRWCSSPPIRARGLWRWERPPCSPAA
jgi:type II secretory pathway pseudopilin PulG